MIGSDAGVLARYYVEERLFRRSRAYRDMDAARNELCLEGQGCHGKVADT